MRILKYLVEPSSSDHEGNKIVIKVPEDATILCIHAQKENIFLWLATEESDKLTNLVLRVFTTGEEFELTDDLDYLGTCFLNNERFVAHFFMEGA